MDTQIVFPAFPPVSMSSHVHGARTELTRIIDQWAGDTLAWLPRRDREPTFRELMEMPPSAWAARHLAVIAPPGLGKTEAAISAIKRLTDAGHRVLYLVPTHRLSGELHERFRNAGIAAHVHKGAEQDCLFPEALSAARALHQPLRAVCGPDPAMNVCRHRAGCPYWQQQSATGCAKVIIASHEFLFHPLPFPFEPDALVIDEAFWQTMLVERQLDIGLFAHFGVHAPNPDLDGLNRLLHGALTAVSGALALPPSLPASEVRRAANLARGLAGQAGAVLTPDMSASKYEYLKRAYSPHCEKAADMATVWEAIARALSDGRRPIPEVWINATGIDLATLRPIRSDLLALPILHMDATGSAPILRSAFRDGVDIRRVDVQPTNLTVLRVQGQYGKRRLEANDALRQSIARYIPWAAQEARTLTITHKSIEADFPKPTAHFGNLRGLDEYADLDSVFIVGRPMPSNRDVWRMARALFTYPNPEPRLTSTPGGGMRYRQPELEAIVEAITDAEVEQAIGRLRAFNKLHVACRVWLLNDALPGRQGVRNVGFPSPPPWLERMIAAGFVPESPKEAARLGFFPSEAAARKAYSRVVPPATVPTGGMSDAVLVKATRIMSPTRITTYLKLDGRLWHKIDYQPPTNMAKMKSAWKADHYADSFELGMVMISEASSH